MKWYSAESAHGTADRAGFWDDTRVLAWSSRAARDAYVLARRETNISVRAIPEDKVTTWATAAIWAIALCSSSTSGLSSRTNSPSAALTPELRAWAKE